MRVTPSDYRSLLGDWLSLKTECAGSGVYEFRYATLFNRAIRGQTVDEAIVQTTRQALEDFAAAAEAANLEPNAWSARRTLVIARAHLSRFSDAKPFIRPAIELHDALLGDRDFMFASTLVYLATNDVETARAVLRNLALRDGTARDDERFGRLETLVNSR